MSYEIVKEHMKRQGQIISKHFKYVYVMLSALPASYLSTCAIARKHFHFSKLARFCFSALRKTAEENKSFQRRSLGLCFSLFSFELIVAAFKCLEISLRCDL